MSVGALYWRRVMIGLAGNARLKRAAQGSARLDRLARRFVGGDDLAAAIETAQSLRDEGMSTSFNYMGEYLADRALVDQNMTMVQSMPGEIEKAGLAPHISIDPTAIGYSLDERLGHANAEKVAAAFGAAATPETKPLLMLDMEDYGMVERTVALHRRFLDLALNTGITLQAYLRRTAADLEPLLKRRTSVRLVKGAFAESKARAFTGRGDIGRNYYNLALTMLAEGQLGAGFLPVFGTHDHTLIDAIVAAAEANGRSPGSYEFEMLYGVRPDLQRELVANGHRVRIYLPFGRDWWPYVARRLGENPANLRFAMRALLSRAGS